MTMNDRQTEPTELAVRYWDWRSGEEKIEETAGDVETKRLLRGLRSSGLRGDVVSRPVMEPPPWVVDKKASAKFDRLAVEEVVALLAEEEIDLAKAASQLDLFATSLIHPPEAVRVELGGGVVPEECLLTTWLQRAADLHETCAKIRAGKVEKADSNDESTGLSLERHLDVLADIADHWGDGDGCLACEVTTSGKTLARV
jgi:hypothetical protein